MTLPLVADTCPMCGAVHGQLDPFWACPEHGHRLHAPIAQGDHERWACPVMGCAYHRIAPRRPSRISQGDPMTAVDTRPTAPVDLMWNRSKHIAAVLPDHIDVKSFIGTAAAALYADAKLMQAAEASPDSFVGALMECASLGHRPGTEEYYLTPRKVKGKPAILGIEGYRGIVERMYRSGAVSSVIVREVCAKDRFVFTEGRDDRPQHSFGDNGEQGGNRGSDFFGANGHIDRGPMVGVYAYAILKDGAVSRVVILSRDDVMKARQSSEGADSEYSPWKQHERAMWWKTAVRRLEPWLPTSSEYRMTEARATAQAFTARQVAPAAPENEHHAIAPHRPVSEDAAQAIAQQMAPEFDRIGIVDDDEREAIIQRLTGRSSSLDATQAELVAALDRLEKADSIGDLQ